MPNQYFRFKQFLVEQDQCTMKVCTDACILGAWFADKKGNHISILDIGSGTGLLMMMLAQKNNAEIDGIEIDLPSYKQSKLNLAGSPWKERLHLYPGDVRSFSFGKSYDFIISNPPFYEKDLRSPSARTNIARHSDELALDELMKACKRLLKTSGEFGLLMPASRTQETEEAARAEGFYLSEKLCIRQTPAHAYFRVIFLFSRHEEKNTAVYELSIQDETGKYTEEFRDLLRDYYLAF